MQAQGQGGPLPAALVYGPALLLRERARAHRPFADSRTRAPRTNGGGCRPEGDASGHIWLKAVFNERFIRPSTGGSHPFHHLKVLPRSIAPVGIALKFHEVVQRHNASFHCGTMVTQPISKFTNSLPIHIKNRVSTFRKRAVYLLSP